MKITKMPKQYDTFEITRKRIIEKQGTCPFCGNSENSRIETIYTPEGQRKVFLRGVEKTLVIQRFGKQKPWYKHMFSLKRYWYIYSFECGECGCKWESDEFPEVEVNYEY